MKDEADYHNLRADFEAAMKIICQDFEEVTRIRERMDVQLKLLSKAFEVAAGPSAETSANELKNLLQKMRVHKSCA